MNVWVRTGLIIAATTLYALRVTAATAPEKIICGVENVEDMVNLPKSPWIIGSGIGDRFFQRGGLHLINKHSLTARKIAVDLSSKLVAQAPYDQCPGPAPATDFSAHGLSLIANSDGTHTLYVVNHGGRESVEVFKVVTREQEPRFNWIGCVLTPQTATSNSVAARRDGSLVLSASAAADITMPSFHELELRAATARGSATELNPQAIDKQRGAVFVWTRGQGWQKVPGSELLGNNGIELSPDEQWAFVNSWPAQSVTRMSLSSATAKNHEAKLDFKPDNIRWSDDGKLVATGHVTSMDRILNCAFSDTPDCATDYKSAEIDPETLEVTPLFSGKGTPQFGAATIGLKTDGALWLGSFRSACIARVRLSGAAH